MAWPDQIYDNSGGLLMVASFILIIGYLVVSSIKDWYKSKKHK